MAIEINHIPHETLRRYDAGKAIIVATDHYLHGRGVYVTTSQNPQDLHQARDLEALETCRRQEAVHAITMVVLKLDNELVEEATSFLDNRYRILAELDTLLRHERTVYVVYAITHSNPEQKPLGPMTVNIGGDCYRDTEQIKDLGSILNRTKDLAQAMLRKAVLIFPDVPALHGGKKGEWIILDRAGRKVEGISEEAIIALGSAIIPRGIEFLNRYKALEAAHLGICKHFPARDYIRPDSGSPDVLSGSYWRGERPDKYINMCEAWWRREIDLHNFTCLPSNLGGTLDGSSRPTGYGVATTAIELARRYFAPRGRDPRGLHFLLEAAGGVGRNTIEALIETHKVPPAQITVFDRNEEACSQVGEKFRVHTVTLKTTDFYQTRLPEDVRRKKRFDVWINNGLGDATRPSDVRNLLRAGVRVFAGGANNFLEVKTQKKSLQRIFAADGWAWPDPATSGGGWTLAVMDLLTRSQRRKANTQTIRKRILEIITTRNARLVASVVDALPEDAGGNDLWRGVDRLIERRVEHTLARQLTPRQMFEAADTTRWELT